MKIKVSELSGAALDWAVAKAEGYYLFLEVDGKWRCEIGDKGAHDVGALGKYGYSPSTNWNQGGPLIDRARMSFVSQGTGPEDEDGNQPILAIPAVLLYKIGSGKTHLIAACRAIVATKFGDEIEIPQELAP